jgi:hypothetical protein
MNEVRSGDKPNIFGKGIDYLSLIYSGEFETNSARGNNQSTQCKYLNSFYLTSLALVDIVTGINVSSKPFQPEKVKNLMDIDTVDSILRYEDKRLETIIKKKKVDVNEILDEARSTLAFVCVISSSVSCLNVLAKFGALFNAKLSNGTSLLSLALQYGNREIVKIILENISICDVSEDNMKNIRNISHAAQIRLSQFRYVNQADGMSDL